MQVCFVARWSGSYDWYTILGVIGRFDVVWPGSCAGIALKHLMFYLTQKNILSIAHICCQVTEFMTELMKYNSFCRIIVFCQMLCFNYKCLIVSKKNKYMIKSAKKLNRVTVIFLSHHTEASASISGLLVVPPLFHSTLPFSYFWINDVNKTLFGKNILSTQFNEDPCSDEDSVVSGFVSRCHILLCVIRIPFHQWNALVDAPLVSVSLSFCPSLCL